MKIVHGNIYVHKSNVDELKENERRIFEASKELLPLSWKWNMIKVAKTKVTFSWYPEFRSDPHPTLHSYATVDTVSDSVKYGHPKNNPVILHRKETFVSKTDTEYETYKRLTDQEVEAGLYPKELLSYIGRRNFWDNFLIEKGVEIENHILKKT